MSHDAGPYDRGQRRTDLLFDVNRNEEFINLHHHRNPDGPMPSLLRNARLEAPGWRRRAPHRLDHRQPRATPRAATGLSLGTMALRFVVEDTDGMPEAQAVGFRDYAD